MLQHVRALPRPLPVPVAGTVVSLTAHAALLGALVVGGGGGPAIGVADETAGPSSVSPPAGGRGERLHWIGIGEGPGTGRARPGERPPSAYVVPGREGARRGMLGSAPGGGRVAGSAFGDVLPPPGAPGPTQEAPPLPDIVLPDVTPLDAATILVAGVLAASPDRLHEVSRPEDFERLERLDGPADFLAAGGAMALTAAMPHARVDVLPIPLVGNPLPPYPAALVKSHTDGSVVVEFRIDSTGVVDLASLLVVESSDPLFTQAVRGVLPLLRFVPARLRAHAVGLTVRQPFVFRVVARR